MNAASLKQAIKASILNNDPLLIQGLPGVGKTAIVAEVTEELGWDLIVSHPSVSDPTDFKGFPWLHQEGKVTVADWVPFGDLRQLIEAKRPTVWLIDDLGQAPPAVQAALMQLVHRDSRSLNGQKLSS